MEDARREAVALANRMQQYRNDALVSTSTSTGSSPQTSSQPSTGPSIPVSPSAVMNQTHDEMPGLRDISDTDTEVDMADTDTDTSLSDVDVPDSSLTSGHARHERQALRSLRRELELYRAEMERSIQRMGPLLDYLRIQGEAVQDGSIRGDFDSARASLAQAIRDMRSVMEEGAARRHRVDSRVSFLQQRLAPQSPRRRLRRWRTVGS
jgi:hypothetical protein